MIWYLNHAQVKTEVHVFNTVDRSLVRLNPRRDLVNHSPDGFAWGYEGSGPAQLALAILADHLKDDDRALAIYQQFKRMVIARLPREHGFCINSDLVGGYVAAIEALNLSTTDSVVDLDEFRRHLKG